MWTNLQLRVSPEETDDFKAALEEHSLSPTFDRLGKITCVSDRFYCTPATA
jgi:hypothetical protein